MKEEEHNLRVRDLEKLSKNPKRHILTEKTINAKREYGQIKDIHSAPTNTLWRIVTIIKNEPSDGLTIMNYYKFVELRIMTEIQRRNSIKK